MNGAWTGDWLIFQLLRERIVLCPLDQLAIMNLILTLSELEKMAK